MRTLLIASLLLTTLSHVLSSDGSWLQGKRRGTGFPATFSSAVTLLRAEQERAQRLERLLTRLTARSGPQNRILGQLIAGQLRFPEAITQYCGLRDKDELEELLTTCRLWEKGETDKERLCRFVLRRAQRHLADYAESSTNINAADVMERLGHEMDAYLRSNGKLVAGATP
jgi:hypothetical protein